MESPMPAKGPINATLIASIEESSNGFPASKAAFLSFSMEITMVKINGDIPGVVLKKSWWRPMAL